MKLQDIVGFMVLMLGAGLILAALGEVTLSKLTIASTGGVLIFAGLYIFLEDR